MALRPLRGKQRLMRQRFVAEETTMMMLMMGVGVAGGAGGGSLFTRDASHLIYPGALCLPLET